MGDEGLQIVSLGNAEDTMPIFGGQSIISTELNGKDYSTFIRTKKENIKFTLLFSSINGGNFTPRTNEILGKIFGKSKPIEFWLEEDPDKILYVIPTSNFEVNKIQGYQGTLPISFESTTPYWLTRIVKEEKFLNYNGTFSIFNRSNIHNENGNYDIFPYFRFKISDSYQILTEQGGYVLTESSNYVLTERSKNILTQNYESPFIFNSDGTINFQITHISDNNRVISFNNLKIGEIIEMEDIFNLESSTQLNRFPNWNKQPFLLHEGNNEFRVNFPCEIFMCTQYPLIR